MTAAAAPSVAVIGLGFGRAHVPGFQAAGARVVAVCQRDETAARKVAGAYGVPHAYARWENMLAAQHPDIVVIATPPHLHRAIARAASAGGAHVLCEKPLATSREDAEAIVADVARAGRVGMTGFNWRFPPAMQRMRALMAEGAIGRVLHVRAHWLGARWADEAAPTTWRMDREQAGHGAMGDMGVHVVDLVRWTCGEFARVSAHAGIAYPDKPVAGTGRRTDAEDYVSLLGELTSGAQVSFVASRAAHGRNEHVLEISGTRGALAYRLTRESPRWYAGTLAMATSGGGLTPVPVETMEVDGSDPMDLIGRATIAPLAARLLAAIRGEAPADPSLADGLRAQLVLEAAREAAARRVWVSVPTA
ncbi:MAG TPA: Gfo/Idh/MocA family oxidoreductase [Methylomirabilota bacterium]